jgi:o-succinylbenzoate---CoA ligase
MEAWLATQAAQRPDEVALIEGSRSLTWQNLARQAGQRAAGLAVQGLGPGSLIAVEAANDLESICWIHAVWWLGASVFPFHPDWPAAVLARRLEELAPGAVVTSDQQRLALMSERSGTLLLDMQQPDESANGLEACRQVGDGDLLTMLWTSGSTGAGRPVGLSVANHRASVRAIADRLHLTARDRWLLCLPLDHIGGLAILVRALITGCSVVVHAHFDPEQVRADLTGQPITLASMVPTMLARLLEDQPGPWSTSLRTLLVGGAPATTRLLSSARASGLPVAPTWGMTEACSQLATLEPGEDADMDFERSPGLVGAPLSGVELRVVPDLELPESDNRTGCLLVRGPMLSPLVPVDDEGWFDTGDIGRIDERGRVIMLHRARDLIISGGVNVHAGEVEQVLGQCPWIADVAVLGLAHPNWGEQVVAVVVPGDNAPDGPDRKAALDHWCRSRLEPAQVPRRWRFVAGLPRTAIGKCRRDALEALFIQPGD